MIDPFEYIDYRKLLKDLYEQNKKDHPFFSYRYIAQKVGFSSPGFFANILQGKRNISTEFIFKFAELFKFKKDQTEYFELLVNYDQAKGHTQKKYYFEKILTHKKSKIKITDAQDYEFYSKWYYTAIREIVDIFPVRDNYEELARLISPPISTDEAQRAIEFLESGGFIEKTAEGFYKQTERFISTGYEAKALAINNFVWATADLAKQSIDRYSREKRALGTLTFSISEEGRRYIEERMKMFTREILEIVRSDKNQDRVYHLNLHLFPMTKV